MYILNYLYEQEYEISYGLIYRAVIKLFLIKNSYILKRVVLI